jgi:hypothetical protein
MVEIDILYFESCPGWRETAQRVREVAPYATVRLVVVETPEEARRLSFPGSPTVRVNGADIDPAASTACGLQCRLYEGARVPSREMIARAVAAAHRLSRSSVK